MSTKSLQNTSRGRNSRWQMFFKIGARESLAIFTEKRLKACDFIKKRLQHRCFPVNIAKFLRTAFFIEHLWWLLLNSLSKILYFNKRLRMFQISAKGSKSQHGIEINNFQQLLKLIELKFISTT